MVTAQQALKLEGSAQDCAQIVRVRTFLISYYRNLSNLTAHIRKTHTFV